MKMKPLKKLEESKAILEMKDGSQVIFLYISGDKVGVQVKSLDMIREVYSNQIERVVSQTSETIIRL